MTDRIFDLLKSKSHLCGPCHRAQGGSGLPSMAAPSMPQIDASGGVHGICDGLEGKEHRAHVDYLGEPMSEEKMAAYRTTREDWNEDVKGGHSFASTDGQRSTAATARDIVAA